jgi:uncharacterized protein (TIGR02597 family)
MTLFPRDPYRAILVAVSCCCLQATADTTDPWGYIVNTVPGGSQRLVGVSLTGYGTFYGTVTGVTATGLTFAEPVADTLFREASSAFLTVRKGSFAGLALTVTGHSGNEITLGQSAAEWIAPGDEIQIFANHTIGDLFGDHNQVGLLAAGDATSADTIGLWNPQTQSSRVFYFRAGEGWREAGNEGAGDQSNATVPYPAALVINRRGSTPLNFTLVGGVPMPLENRYFQVTPGRNLISAPFTVASRIADYGLFESGSPYSMLGAASAPEADTIRLSNFSAATDTQVMYYRLGQGWRFVGTEGDAGDTPIELGQSMDFQRRGPAGIIKALGIAEQGPSSVARSVSISTAIVPIRRMTPAAGGMQIEWTGEAGATYQIQTCPTGEAAWTNLGEPVAGSGESFSSFCQPSGQGFLRIVMH